jgi:hypothetical protein
LNHFGNDGTNIKRMFDGNKNYTGDQNLRLHQSKVEGDNVLMLKLSRPLPAGSVFTYYFENDDLDGDAPSDFVGNLQTYLTAKNYSISTFDTNKDGILNNADFDKNGDNKITSLSGVDYSPLGVTIQLYWGNPGYPAGKGNGTLVQTEFSPVQLIKAAVYSHTITATTSFDHIVFESNPDGSGQDPRLVEIELNNKVNVPGQSTSNTFNFTFTC